MRKMGKRLLSALLAVVLIITLIPPLDTAHAAVSIVITKPTASSQANPLNVTTRQINIEFNFAGLSDADLLNVIYRVENITSSISEVIRDNPPQKLGTGQGLFQNVELTEGLNKIVVIFDSGSKPESLPVWVNYTEVTTISNLKIDGRTFVNGMIVPNNNSMASGAPMIFVEGYAPNATEVIGYSTLTPNGDRSDFLLPLTGQFSMSAGHDQMAELQLRPGDNEMTLVASNPFKTYRADRHFVYNNGNAFLYNTVVSAVYGDVKPLGASDEKRLFKQPTFEGTSSTGPFGISLTTDIKINRDTDGFTHNEFELQITGSNPIVGTIDRSSYNGTSVEITIPSNMGANQTRQYTVESYDDYYLIKNVLIQNIAFNTSNSHQVLNVTFNPIGIYPEHTQQFEFYFVNENQPFIKSVTITETNQELYSGIILTSSFNLSIEPGNTVNAVNIYLSDGVSESLIATTNTTDGSGNFTISLNKDYIPEGESVLRFVPVTGGIENPLGSRSYTVHYNPSPYVYLTNIVNGFAYSDPLHDPKLVNKDGVVVSNSTPVLQIKPVNIPEAQYDDIRIRWNDKSDRIRIDNTGFNASRTNYAGEGYTLTGDVVKDSSNNFIEFRFQFGPNTHGNRNWSWVEGLNNLVIEVYEDGSLEADGSPKPGAVPITTMKYELFYFTDALPNIGNIDLTPELKATGNYITVDGEAYRYYTQQSSMRFTASFVESNTVEVRVNTLNEDGAPVQRISRLVWNGNTFAFDTNYDTNLIAVSGITPGTVAADNGNATITSMTINLYGSGTNTVEVLATNKAGNFTVRTMEIIREPAPFLMHYPVIDQNPVTKAWEGRINGNYTRIILEAEQADKIIYAKNQEVTRKQTMMIGGVNREVFVFEVKGLKRGNNKVSFTIIRGTRSDQVEVNLVNADTPVPGAEFKESISKANIRAFNNQLQLKFPRGTILKRNNTTAADQYLSPSRDILMAIASPNDGRVNKYLHPAGMETSAFPKNGQWESNFSRITNINPRFRKASPLFWIDGGYIPLQDSATQQDVLYGSGIYPYERGKEYYLRNSLNMNDQFVPSQTGELTLSYDPNMVSSSWRYVTVFHYGYNEDYMGRKQYEWKNIGGVVDPKKNTITVPFTEFGYYVVMYMDQSFDDIIGHPWARDMLDTLYSKGIMNNKQPLRFETNEPITRGEFVTLIVKALDIPLNYEGTGTFSDVTRVNPLSFGLYEYKYIETAARAGIARGTQQRRFLPNNPITREDAASLLARAMNLNISGAEARVNSSLQKSFTDALDIGTYARASVEAVVKKKLMEGKPNRTDGSDKPTYYFDPKANLTRAEASAVIMKMLLDKKRVPSL